MPQLQVKEGIDAVIVDNVLAIRKGLTEAGFETESRSTDTSTGASANGMLSPEKLQQQIVDAVDGVPIVSQTTDGGVQLATFSS